MPATAYYAHAADPVRVYRDPLRRVVADHVLLHHRPGPVRSLGLPGVGWRYEAMLRASFGPARGFAAVGVEMDRKVYADVARTAPAWATLAPPQRLSAFVRTTTEVFTCAWLDLTAKTGTELFQCCAHLGARLGPGPAPYAVTFAVGREQPWVSAHMDAQPHLLGLPATQRRAAVLHAALHATRRAAAPARSVAVYGTSAMGVLLGVFA